MTDTPMGLVSTKYTNKADEYTVANATFNAKDKNLIFCLNVIFFCSTKAYCTAHCWISSYSLAKGIVKKMLIILFKSKKIH